jgi:hypothetical protein
MGQRRRNHPNSTGSHNSNIGRAVGFDPNEDMYQNNDDNDQLSLNMNNLDHDGSQGLAVGGDIEGGHAVEPCPNVPQVYPGGITFIEGFDQDSYISQRTEVPWYPFASQKDWEVAHWLMRAGLSMVEIDEYLNLNFVSFPSALLSSYRAHRTFIQYQTKEISLSFHNAKELRQRVEMLPSGPRWKYEDIITDVPTKRTLRLFYRDPIKCLQSLLSNPHLADHIDFNCRKVYESVDKDSRVYNSFMTGDHSWYLQVRLYVNFQC